MNRLWSDWAPLPLILGGAGLYSVDRWRRTGSATAPANTIREPIAR